MYTECGKQMEAGENLDLYYPENRSEKIHHSHLKILKAVTIAFSSGEPLTFVEYLLRARLFDATSRGGSLVFSWPVNSLAPA